MFLEITRNLFIQLWRNAQSIKKSLIMPAALYTCILALLALYKSEMVSDEIFWVSQAFTILLIMLPNAVFRVFITQKLLSDNKDFSSFSRKILWGLVLAILISMCGKISVYITKIIVQDMMNDYLVDFNSWSGFALPLGRVFIQTILITPLLLALCLVFSPSKKSWVSQIKKAKLKIIPLVVLVVAVLRLSELSMLYIMDNSLSENLLDLSVSTWGFASFFFPFLINFISTILTTLLAVSVFTDRK